MKRHKAKDRLHKATTEALESKIDILEMDLKEEFQIWMMIYRFIIRYFFTEYLISIQRASMAQSDGESSASSDDETIDRLKEEVANLQVRFLAPPRWWWHRDAGDIVMLPSAICHQHIPSSISVTRIHIIWSI